MFGFGEKRFVGVDIGNSNMKLVELTVNGNKPVLTNYAWLSISSLEEKRDMKLSYFDLALPQYLKKMISEANISSNQAYLSIPSSGGLVTLIEFPEIDEKELDQVIMFEAKKHIPMSLDDVSLDWNIVKKDIPKRLITKDSKESSAAEEKKGSIEVLLVAAPKNKILRYEQLAENAGLKVKLIEVESFSLVRSLIGSDQGNFVIVDIGSKVCNIILVEKGLIRVNRNMDAGGRDLTKIISRSMNIDEERAEKAKMAENSFLSEESSMKFPPLDLIIGEVARVIKSYYGDSFESSIDSVILSGGTAQFSGIEKYFSDNLKIKTVIGNSLGRIEYDKKIAPRAKELGSLFSVAIGLALSGVEASLKK